MEVYLDTWSEFKTLVANKGLKMQYYSHSGLYKIFAIDNGVLWKHEVEIASPAPSESDQEDFEDNYKDDANGTIVPNTSSVDRAINISSGSVNGYSSVHKFGRNPDVDIDTDPEDVWSYGGSYTFLSSAQTLYVSSSDASDTTQSIKVEGLDANWEPQTQSATLNGQNQVALSGTWLRVFRAYNDSGTNLNGDVYVAESDTLTGGVPDTASKVKAHVESVYQQTLMAIYTIPAGKTGYLVKWYITINSNGSTSEKECDAALYTRLDGKVFRLKEYVGLDNHGAGSWNYDYPIPLKLPEKTDVKVVADTVSSNNTDVTAGFDIILIDN